MTLEEELFISVKDFVGIQRTYWNM